MALHVAVRDAVRHALVADRFEQPIKDDRRVMSAYRGDGAVSRQANPSIVHYARRARDLADVSDQPGRSTELRQS